MLLKKSTESFQYKLNIIIKINRVSWSWKMTQTAFIESIIETIKYVFFFKNVFYFKGNINCKIMQFITFMNKLNILWTKNKIKNIYLYSNHNSA